jgi:hypothetical protein
MTFIFVTYKHGQLERRIQHRINEQLFSTNAHKQSPAKAVLHVLAGVSISHLPTHTHLTFFDNGGMVMSPC